MFSIEWLTEGWTEVFNKRQMGIEDVNVSHLQFANNTIVSLSEEIDGFWNVLFLLQIFIEYLRVANYNV